MNGRAAGGANGRSRPAPDAHGLEHHFAELMARLDGGQRPEVPLTAALLGRATAEGHVCLDLTALAGRPLPDAVPGAPPAPPLDRWRGALAASPVVGAPGAATPLVLDAADRVYLQRYWLYERDVAAALRALAAGAAEGVDEVRLARDLQRLFPPGPDPAVDWQKAAAAVAVVRRLAVISGGPGTGKTTTVIGVLAALAAQPGGERLRIALAAPTGKAANRLQEAVRAGRARPDMPALLRERIPTEAATVHRLLGPRPGSVRFRHDRARPLPLDVLVVDEASMIDLALMAKLLDALPAAARLILLGDRDQLASVEAGAVLGDLCAGAGGFSASQRERLARLTGVAAGALPDGGPGTALADCIVLLTRSYRFHAGSAIARLAGAVNAGRADAALEVLRGADRSGIAWVEPVSGHDGAAIHASVAGYRPYLESVRTGAAPAQVFAAFNRFRVLCAHRRGPAGVARLNRVILEALERSGLVTTPQGDWFAGRPVIITENSYELRLFNGDIGIALPDPAAGGRLRVCFEAPAGDLRRYAPARLPAHEPAFALTVHKAQGSEFEQVLLLLPEAPSPVLTRELLYTALTRARRRVEIHAREAALRAAIAQRVQRTSALRERLWDPARSGAG